MRVLVTGGAGYIGSHTCKHLAQKGYEPIVYDNLSRGHQWAVRWGDFELGDLRDTPRLTEVLRRRRIEAVIHFAAYALVGESVAQPELYYSNNTVGSLSLLEAMRAAGVCSLVFSSTCATYGYPEREVLDESHPTRPINPYGASKLFVERMIADAARAYGHKAICLRYFNAAGADPEGELGEVHDPETHLIPNVLRSLTGEIPFFDLHGEDYPTPDGTCIRDYVHVQDLARAHLLALRALQEGKPLELVCNLGTATGHSVKEAVACVESVTGKKVSLRVGPRRPGDPARLVASNERARNLLGWEPYYTDLRQTIEHAWNWHLRRTARFGRV
jgi:UDP-glucose-4-epimerase GalE